MKTVAGHDDEERAERHPDGEPGEAGRDDTAPGVEAAGRRGRFDSGRVWMVAACLLLFAAATLLYLGRPNAAFVVAALGVSAWFLDVRTNLKRKHDLVKRGARNWEPRGRVEEERD